MKAITTCLIILALGVAVPIYPSTAPLTDRLAGTWQGSGKAFGGDAQMNLKFEWVLGKKFLRLGLKTEMMRNGQSQTFEGHAYYQTVAEGKLKAVWFDSRGVTFPIEAQIEGDSLIANWGTAETEQGKSVYRLLDDGKLEVIDSVKQRDGSWREFGRFVIARQGA